jgi:hypothetical protein
MNLDGELALAQDKDIFLLRSQDGEFCMGRRATDRFLLLYAIATLCVSSRDDTRHIMRTFCILATLSSGGRT